MIITHKRVMKALYLYTLFLTVCLTALFLSLFVINRENPAVFTIGLASFMLTVFRATKTREILSKLSTITSNQSILYARSVMKNKRKSMIITTALSLGSLLTGVPLLILSGVPVHLLQHFYCSRLAARKLNGEM